MRNRRKKWSSCFFQTVRGPSLQQSPKATQSRFTRSAQPTALRKKQQAEAGVCVCPQDEQRALEES